MINRSYERVVCPVFGEQIEICTALTRPEPETHGQSLISTQWRETPMSWCSTHRLIAQAKWLQITYPSQLPHERPPSSARRQVLLGPAFCCNRCRGGHMIDARNRPGGAGLTPGMWIA